MGDGLASDCNEDLDKDKGQAKDATSQATEKRTGTEQLWAVLVNLICSCIAVLATVDVTVVGSENRPAADDGPSLCGRLRP